MRSANFCTALFMLCATTSPLLCGAQEYPSKPIQLIIPATAGTTGDLLARLLAPKLSQRWNVPFVVENKVGAGGAIGIADAAKANPDGYTFLFSTTAFSTLAALRPQLSYDPIKDFAPVALVGKSPLVLVVADTVPARTVGEFVDYVKKQPPGRLNYATPGVGSVHHMTMELFQQETGTSMTHVPYKGTSGALTDLAAGHVQASFVVMQTAAPLVQSGKIRMLAVVAENRTPQFPDVPTLAELGLKKMVIETWVGVAAPAGTPKNVIAKMNREIDSLLTLPDVKEAMDKMGVVGAGGDPEKLGTLVRNEIKMWSAVVKEANITVD